MKVGYVRVSTKEQNIDRQTDMMEALGVEKMYIDKKSGKNAERPELQQMLSFVREDDSVVVESISRIARNVKDLLEIVDMLNEKKVKFISKKENIDTTTPTGKFMLTVFGAMAELERNFILERQAEGIEAAKKRGKHLGRPKRVSYPDNWLEVYNAWRAGEITAVQARAILKLKKSSFYKLVGEYEGHGEKRE